LSGEVGAGKTHFARSIIQSLLEAPEDVPSPTFTLVQSYETEKGEIWHADLYRLTSTLEIEELGLTDAFDRAICLVEWPDRLDTLVPNDALHLHLADGENDDARTATLHWTDNKWKGKLAAWHTT
jgi:tRNA threonylcarbamoyladenosine biosynthesis protein TsaE